MGPDFVHWELIELLFTIAVISCEWQFAEGKSLLSEKRNVDAKGKIWFNCDQKILRAQKN